MPEHISNNINTVVEARKDPEHLGQMNETPESIKEKIQKIRNFWNPEMKDTPENRDKRNAVISAILMNSFVYNIDQQEIADWIYGKGRLDVYKLLMSGAVKPYEYRSLTVDDGQGNMGFNGDEFDPVDEFGKPDIYKYSSRREINLKINNEYVLWIRIYTTKTDPDKFKVGSKLMKRKDKTEDGLILLDANPFINFLEEEEFATLEEAHKEVLQKYQFFLKTFGVIK